MQSSKIWIWVGIAVAVIALIAIVFFVVRSLPPGPASSGDTGNSAPSEPPSPTRQEVPSGTVVPEVSSTNLPSGVAQPESVKPSGGSSSPYLRNFHLTVKNDAVSPNNIVAYAGDILTISFESGDKSYEFVQPDFGLGWQIPAGGAKTLQFQATTPGKFIFYCPSCGGPDRGPVGYITAAPR